MDINKHGLPGRDVSCWVATTPETGYPSLNDDIKVDVAVIGGGIAGITAATLLKHAGLNVAVIESGHIVKGVTGNRPHTHLHYRATSTRALSIAKARKWQRRALPRARRLST